MPDTERGPRRCFLSATLVALLIIGGLLALNAYVLMPHLFPTSAQMNQSPLALALAAALFVCALLLFCVWPSDTLMLGLVRGIIMGLVVVGILLLGYMWADPSAARIDVRVGSTQAAFSAMAFGLAAVAATYASYKWIILKG